MPRRPLISLLTIAVVTCVPLTSAWAAPAAPEDARAHFEAAAELYAREDYAAAASEFAIAYALDPQVDTLFAWAQAERLAEHYTEALKLYERLLEGELSASQREAVQTLRFQVRGELEIAQPEPAASEPEPVEPTTAPSEGSGPAPSQDPGHDPAAAKGGGALVGVGVGMTVIAGGLLIGAAVADGRARGAQTYPEFEAAYDPRTGRGRGSVALYASGGAIAAAGLTTLIVGIVRMKRSRQQRPVAFAPVLSRDRVGVALTIGSWP
ncbi:hypothetical protein ENSA5_01640 [Enhygromyxa salina]|uniref:Tetratricopeptide repeat protein n=1 Tax=Enhygromyxa salina TaxID=215803 RepID=A0A2S9YLA0_9BACT|nr:hypothetical protein [Enhygromyxa salina]PRQ05844.1 hypothetical protein ENSA5_01640 [Enhygromyxa salina]